MEKIEHNTKGKPCPFPKEILCPQKWAPHHPHVTPITIFKMIALFEDI